jgi:hypothetical protein
MKRYFCAYLLVFFFLGGCNSIVCPSPPVKGPIPAIVQNNPELQEEPHFTAALPVHEEATAEAEQPKQKVFLVQKSVEATRVARPDTTIRLSTKASIDQTRDADTFTTVANVVGGMLALLGIILIIAAFASTATGWLPIAYLVYGMLALGIGAPFLLFRSKNSTRKRKANERRAARRAARSQQ